MMISSLSLWLSFPCAKFMSRSGRNKARILLHFDVNEVLRMEGEKEASHTHTHTHTKIKDVKTLFVAKKKKNQLI
jgi:hypothetical protein